MSKYIFNFNNLRVLGYYINVLIALSMWPAFYLGGIYFYLPAIVIFIIIPLLDHIVGENRFEHIALKENWLRSFILESAPMAYILSYTVTLVYALVQSTGLSIIEWLGLAISMGALGSLGITAAHELIHKRGELHKLIGRLCLMLVGYMHFEISHIYGHHKDANTEADNSTAWLGESFYSYFARTVPACFLFAWRFEAHKKNVNHRILKNKVLYYTLLPILISVLVFCFLDIYGLLLFLTQAFISVLLLEAVSYIEHYGLMRAKQGGMYEPQTYAHSWDTYHALSNYMLYNLQRHGDHHIRATRPYPQLKCSLEAPLLPAGYPSLVGLIFIPPLWRAVIHPILEHESTKVRRPSSQSRTPLPSQKLAFSYHKEGVAAFDKLQPPNP